MTIQVRPITADEVTAFRHNMFLVFGFPGSNDEDARERFLQTMDLSRTYAAFDGDELIGTAAAFDFELTIPGAVVPMAGLTQVSVRPSHRRRGIMRRMLEAHLADVRQRGESLSGLWCSETPIYGRFGYGAVGDSDAIVVDTRGARLVYDGELDATALIEPDAARELLPSVYDAIRPGRPGLLSRSPAWWDQRWFLDRPEHRRGAGPKRYAVARRDDQVTGYVLYRQHAKFEDGVADGTIAVIELQARDARAEVSLWRLLLDMDLYNTVKWWNAPSDSVLPWVVADMRRVTRKRIDHLWLWVNDVPAALGARRYTGAGTLRFRLRDTEQTWQLEVDGEVGTCTPCEETAELEFDVPTLGSLYMGGVHPELLRRAGRLHGSDAAVATAARLFAWPLAPWCPEVF